MTLLLLLFACRDPGSGGGGSAPPGPDADVEDTAADTGAPPEPLLTPEEEAWAELASRIERHLSAADVPGMQVSVVLDGELAYQGGFGVTAYGGESAVTAETVFRWASVTKMHTAAAVLQLVEAGEVDLQAPITQYVPYFSLLEGFDPGSVTTHAALSHTAALPDELWWSCNASDDALRSRIENVWEMPLYAPVGSFYNYSNSGYTLAGALLEEVSGRPYRDAMRERVLDPAGMETATFDVDEAAAGPHADGTEWYDGGPYYYRLAEWDCAPSRPAAWLHGTAADLARTAEWQLAGGGGLLSAELTDAMRAQEDTRALPDGGMQVGYGLFQYDYNGVTVVMHDGWVTGFVSAWAIVPERGFGVAIVANADWADVYTPMYDAIDLFLGLDPAPPADYTTFPASWGPYTGTYVDPWVNGTIAVTLEENRLYADFVDLGAKVELFQEAGEQFWMEIEPNYWVDVRFIPDDAGEYRWFVTRYGVGERQEGQAIAPPAISRARWESAIERYGRPERPAPGRLRPGAM